MTTGVGTQTLGQMTVENRTLYELKMLRVATGPFLHSWFAQEGSVFPVFSLPENQGDTIQWSKPVALSNVTDALTEAVTPEPLDMTITVITATVYEYGAYIRYSKKLAQMGIHKVAVTAADLLGRQAGDSFDLITRAGLVAETSNVQYANGRASTAAIVAGDYFTASEALKALTTLKVAKAAPVLDGKYPALLHPNTIYDLFADPVMQAVLAYVKDKGDANDWIEGFIGEAFGLSFYSTPNGYHATSTVEVYSTTVIGKDSFGVGGLAGMMPSVVREVPDGNHTFEDVRPVRMIDKPFGSAGTSDPLNQRASIGWTSTYAFKVLDATFFVRVEHDTAL